MKSAPSKAEDGVGAAEAVFSAGAALACGFTVEKNSGSPVCAILLMGVRTPGSAGHAEGNELHEYGGGADNRHAELVDLLLFMRHACFLRRFRGFRLLRDILCGLLCGSPCASLRTGGCALCLPLFLAHSSGAFSFIRQNIVILSEYFFVILGLLYGAGKILSSKEDTAQRCGCPLLRFI